MWSKAYLIVLAVAVTVTTFLTYYLVSWLWSIGDPAAALNAFYDQYGFSWLVFFLFTTALLILGHAVLWVSGRAWAIWTTLIYFLVFTLVYGFWIANQQDNFLREHFQASTVGPGLGYVLTVILCLVAGVVAFGSFFLNVWLRGKTYPPVPDGEPSTISEKENGDTMVHTS
jgi:hypothetical protein